MNSNSPYIAVPVPAMHAFMAKAGTSDLAIYLSGRRGCKPVLYREAGIGLSEPDIQRLSEQGVRSLFVREDDLARWDTCIEEKLAEILGAPELSSEEKTKCVYLAGTSVAHALIEEPAGTETLHRATRFVEAVIESVLVDHDVSDCFLQMAGHHLNTACHMFSTSVLAVMLGAEVWGSNPDQLRPLGLAAMLHDLGKTVIDPRILDKQGPLTGGEIGVVMQHPVESVRLINDHAQVTATARQMILQHHERVDGGGYPLGLSGDELLPGSKMLSIVDAFHALIGPRAYRNSLSAQRATEILELQVGKQFDAEVFARWKCLVTRCQPHKPLGEVAFSSGACGESRSWFSHRLAQRNRKMVRRQPRLLCHRPIQVGCVYAGRLSGASSASDTFVSTLHDVSASGVCLRRSHPAFRGEILHLVIMIHDTPIWLKGTVAWCQKDPEDGRYRVGVRLTGRISAEEARQKCRPEAATLPLQTNGPAPSAGAAEAGDEGVRSIPVEKRVPLVSAG